MRDESLTNNIARAIQDHLLKDFGSKSEFSDWFSREDETSSTARPKRPVVIQPNPINVEHDKKLASLEARIKRLVKMFFPMDCILLNTPTG